MIEFIGIDSKTLGVTEGENHNQLNKGNKDWQLLVSDLSGYLDYYYRLNRLSITFVVILNIANYINTTSNHCFYMKQNILQFCTHNEVSV